LRYRDVIRQQLEDKKKKQRELDEREKKAVRNMDGRLRARKRPAK
jgi:hypothetical protein